jgi:hypothetical protein
MLYLDELEDRVRTEKMHYSTIYLTIYSTLYSTIYSTIRRWKTSWRLFQMVSVSSCHRTHSHISHNCSNLERPPQNYFEFDLDLLPASEVDPGQGRGPAWLAYISQQVPSPGSNFPCLDWSMYSPPMFSAASSKESSAYGTTSAPLAPFLPSPPCNYFNFFPHSVFWATGGSPMSTRNPGHHFSALSLEHLIYVIPKSDHLDLHSYLQQPIPYVPRYFF